jgi:hypothetical protein
MKPFLRLLVLAWLVFRMVAPVQAADDHVALVKSVSGRVQVIRQGQTVDVTPDTTLRVDDRVVAASQSTAAIVFRDGTLLTLGGGADILVRDYVFEPKTNQYAFSLYMAKGSAIYESGKISKVAPDAVKVETPTATVGVRGTRFLIEAN